MVRHAIYGPLVASACLLVGGCNTSSPTSPLLAFTPGPAPTVYVGTVADSASGKGTLTVVLASAAGLTSGTWQMAFDGKADPMYFVSGTLSGGNYAATVTTCFDTDFASGCSSNCTFSFTGSLTSSSLGGTYTAVSNQSCLGRTGTIDTKH
jgi:hypothetical protein